MTLAQFFQKLKTLGYPVAYSHFEVDENNPPPSLPFIMYIETSPTIHRADDVAHSKVLNVDIELYSNLKDGTAESKIENMLNENEIPYEISELIYIDDEKIFQRVFSISLI